MLRPVIGKLKGCFPLAKQLNGDLVGDFLFCISSKYIGILKFNLQFEVILNFLIMGTIGSTQYSVRMLL